MRPRPLPTLAAVLVAAAIVACGLVLFGRHPPAPLESGPPHAGFEAPGPAATPALPSRTPAPRTPQQAPPAPAEAEAPATAGSEGPFIPVEPASAGSPSRSEEPVAVEGPGKGLVVAILSPSTSAPYGSSVMVTGRVVGPADASDPLATMGDLAWSVNGTDLGAKLEYDRDGAFSFSFSSVGLRGFLTVRVEARDRNGQRSGAQVVLPDRDGGPPLSIDSPADNATYSDEITVAGRAGDPADPSAAPAEVKSLRWRVVGSTALAGTAPVGKDGGFEIAIPTAGLTGPQVIEVLAEDLNGRVRVRTIALSAAPAAAAPGAAPPGLVVESPADNSPYGSSITVSGAATNSAADEAADAVDSVSWRLAGTALHGASNVGPDGRFSFTVRTAGLRGTQALTVRASAPSGLFTEKLVILIDDGRGVPVVVTSPPDGGYYRSAIAVEGVVADVSRVSELKSLTWEVSGRSDLGGRVFPDLGGRFRFAVPFGQAGGDVLVLLTSEDYNGHTEQARVSLRDGTRKPVIVVSVPAKGTAYGSALRVAGVVSDPYAGQPGMEGMESFNWLVSPVVFSRASAPLRGSASVGPDGAFRFTVASGGLTGEQDLTLTAVGTSGNRAEITVRIPQGESDLPSLLVTPSDRRVTLRWDPAPFAVRYDLAWAQGNGPPELGTVREGVVSPVVLGGLNNGDLYSLKVRVVFDDGGSGWSTLARVIPLSAEHLAPTVTGDYQQIRLSWDAVAGAEAYEVWRSTSVMGGYDRVATALATTSFVDTRVEFGKEYFYSVAPAGPLAPLSAPASGRSLAFPAEKLAALGSAPSPGALGVRVVGGYAYVCSGPFGVRIVDVTDPAKMVEVGVIGTGDARDVALRGDYAYVADGESGLRVVDVSAPRSPVLLGSRKTIDAHAVALAGSSAYVADGAKGLKVIDISDTRTLARIGTMESVNALDLAVHGSLLYLADGSGGLKVVDISAPAAPVVVASVQTTDARAVCLAPGLALVADGPSGLRVVDVSNPLRPVLLSTFKVVNASAVCVGDGFAYVTDAGTGIRVVDLSDPAHPALFSTHARAGAAAVDVVGRRAYIADGSKLAVMGVQIQGRSFRVAAAALGGRAYGVSISGGWAYVSGHAQGIEVVDVRDPSRVSEASVSAAFATRFAVSVSIQDTLAFVADGTGGIMIVDVSAAWDGIQSTAPAAVGSYRPGGTVSRVVAVGTIAYVAAGEQGVRVLDMRAPAAPQEIGGVATTNASDIVVSGSWAWVADGDGGVRVLDISTPSQPRLLPTGVAMNARVLSRSGSLLFAAGSAGVSVIDVSDPRAPVLRGRYDTRAAQGIDASGKYVYVAEGHKGLTVLDVSNPARPAVVSSCEDVFAVDVAVSGSYAVVADLDGLSVIQVLIPEWLRK